MLDEVRGWLESLDSTKLAEHLIGGVSYFDIPDEIGGQFVRTFRDSPVSEGFILPPLPTRSSRATTESAAGLSC